MLKKCASKNLVAICRFVPRLAASVRLVALIPQVVTCILLENKYRINSTVVSPFTVFYVQEEELDEHNVQLSPPGFHLIFLPFADDLRKLSYEDTPRGMIALK